MAASFNVNHAREFRLDLGHLPFTQTIKGSKIVGMFIMLFSGIWGGISASILVTNLLQGRIDDITFLLPVFTIIATILFLAGLHEFSRVTTASIDASRISFSWKSLVRSKQWMEELGRYEGIAYREEFHAGNKNSSPYTFYIVELYHADTKKTVITYQSTSVHGVRAIWEDSCRKLNLPAVEKDGSTLIKRNVEDLDKSVRDLVKDGKLSIDFDPSRPPPKGLKVNAAGDIFEVILTKDKSLILIYIFALLIPGIFIFVGFNHEDGLPFSIIGIIIGLVIVSALLWEHLTKESIKIGEDTISLGRIAPWGETAGATIITSQIESVVVDKKDNHFYKKVFIKTDQQQEAIGGGLSAEALEWLKNCILSIISA